MFFVAAHAFAVAPQDGKQDRKTVHCLMRWLMIALFVSVAALLIASAGMARHVWRRHKQTEQTQEPQSAEEEIHTEEGK